MAVIAGFPNVGQLNQHVVNGSNHSVNGSNPVIQSNPDEIKSKAFSEPNQEKCTHG